MTIVNFAENGEIFFSKSLVQNTNRVKSSSQTYTYLPSYSLYPHFSQKKNSKNFENFLSFDNSSKLAGICYKTMTNQGGLMCVQPSQLRFLREKIYKGKIDKKNNFGLSAKTDVQNGGVFVFKVAQGGEADRRGLKMGDTILEVGGRRVEDVNSFVSRIGFGMENNERILVLRNGKVIELDNQEE